MKRRIAAEVTEADRDRLRRAIGYGGNPEHKRNPGDFGLTPPAQPRPDKTLCDAVEVFQRTVARELLQRGVERGLVSEVPSGGWPQNIWSVADDGTVVEAQLENAGQGTYHGYPLPENDPFVVKVRQRWDEEEND